MNRTVASRIKRCTTNLRSRGRWVTQRRGVGVRVACSDLVFVCVVHASDTAGSVCVCGGCWATARLAGWLAGWLAAAAAAAAASSSKHMSSLQQVLQLSCSASCIMCVVQSSSHALCVLCFFFFKCCCSCSAWYHGLFLFTCCSCVCGACFFPFRRWSCVGSASCRPLFPHAGAVKLLGVGAMLCQPPACCRGCCQKIPAARRKVAGLQQGWRLWARIVCIASTKHAMHTCCRSCM
ncbi:hypothetical protein COO60DRAFT_140959 [Scenedesmus sp. NREL 46B-D3]|nr:hypothetical protein COO60DRAFT_140959 [Scenedesmus sp. NREL 46B-D3]